MLNDTLVSTTLLERSGAAYWRRIGERARQSLGATSSIIAERLPGMDHLVVRVLDGVEPGHIRERRLDVRRSPYRKPVTTLSPAWHDEYLIQGRTLLVPLLVEETELVGFWMVSFERRSQVSAAHMELIAALAHELAQALVAERTHEGPFDGEPDAAPGVDAGLAALAEALPFGVFVASLWGEIRYANTALVQTCMQRRIDLAATEGDMVTLLSELTLRRVVDIHDELRTLVQAHEVCLRGDGVDIVVSCQPTDGARLVVCRLVPKAPALARGSLDHALDVETLTPIEDELPPRRITRPLYTLAG